jgi:hypothetical protein
MLPIHLSIDCAWRFSHTVCFQYATTAFILIFIDNEKIMVWNSLNKRIVQ